MRIETTGMNNVRGLVVEIDGDRVKIDASRASRGGGTISTVDLDRYRAFLGCELPEFGESLADWYKAMLDAAVSKGAAPVAGAVAPGEFCLSSKKPFSEWTVAEWEAVGVKLDDMAKKSSSDTVAVNIPVVYFAGVRNKNLAKLSQEETDQLVSFLCTAVAEAL